MTGPPYLYPYSIYVWYYANDAQRQQLENLKEGYVTFHGVVHERTISASYRLQIESRFCETVGLTTCLTAISRFHVSVVMRHLGIPVSQFHKRRVELEAYKFGEEDLTNAERLAIDDTIAHLTRSLKRTYSKHGFQ